MNALQRAWDFLRGPQPLIEYREVQAPRTISHQLDRPQWPERNVETYSSEGYQKLALIFRCIGVLSQSVASAPLRVYQETAQGDEIDDRHPLRQLLSQPNRETNEARLIAQIVMTMSVAGFCVVEKERAASGRVIGLWPINPSWCRPIPRRDSLPDWEIRVPGHDPVTLESDDVIALTYADRPDWSPTGISPIEVILREVSLTNIQIDFLKAFFDQGAMPVYALIPRQDAGTITQAQADVIRERWRQRYAGMRASVDPAILAGIEDVRRLSFDFDELAWTDLRDLSDLAICQAFGIPPVLVGTRYGLERSTFANYQEARKSFYEDTVSPFWNRVEDAFARSLMPEFERRPGYFLNFDTSDVPALREDIMPRREWAVRAFQAGAISSHQFARECDIQPLGPDVFLRSIAVMEIPATVPTGRRSIPATITENRAHTAFEQRQRTATAGREQYIRLAEQFEPEIAAYLQGQKERVISKATRAAIVPETRDIADLDWLAESELLRQLLERLHMVAGEVAFSLTATTYGPESLVWDVTNPNIMQLVGRLGQRIVGITETTRGDVERVVLDSLTEGVSMDELAGRIEHLFDITYNGRAENIARTEAQVAYNEASALSYREAGFDRIQLFDNSEHTDNYGAADGWSCAQRNGQIVPTTQASLHIEAEHPRGTLAIAPYVEVLA